MIEELLGCDAGSRAVPDFADLKLELKIIPVNGSGKPWETTAITSISFMKIPSWTWKESRVYHKTRFILFVPIISRTKETHIRERILKNPFIWSPSSDQDTQLMNDWKLVAKFVRDGRADQLSGRMGVYMQPRKKGRDSKDMVDAPGPKGTMIRVKRRAFYFRKNFTEPIVRKHFRISYESDFKQIKLME